MKQLFAIWDRKAKAHGPIMSYAHEAQAVRDFGQAVQDPQSTLNKYPADFELQQVGYFYDVQGGTVDQPVSGCDPRVVITAEALLMAQSAGPQIVKEA